MGARDEGRREDNFSLKDPAILRMRLVSGSLSLDMMIVRREQEVAVTEAVRLCPSHGKLSPSSLIRNTEVCFSRIDIDFSTMQTTAKSPLTSSRRGP